MGIKTNSNNILWKATDVSTRELRQMALHNAHKLPSEKIIMDVDVSNIAHVLSRRSSSYEKLVLDTASYLKDLAIETGFIVTAVFDGDCRPHSKRDSFKRRFEHHMKLINSSYCRQTAMMLASKENKTEEDEQNLKTVNNESKKLNSQRLIVSNESYTDVKSKLDYINAHDEDGNTGGYVSRQIIKAEYEADYVIASRYRSKSCDILLSQDMDYSVIAGPKCICVKTFKVVTEKCKDKRDQRKQNIYERRKTYFFE